VKAVAIRKGGSNSCNTYMQLQCEKAVAVYVKAVAVYVKAVVIRKRIGGSSTRLRCVPCCFPAGHLMILPVLVTEKRFLVPLRTVWAKSKTWRGRS
jgi:hypothetical protein